MICPKCQSYMLHHPESHLSKHYKKCVTCGYCHKIPDLYIVPTITDYQESTNSVDKIPN